MKLFQWQIAARRSIHMLSLFQCMPLFQGKHKHIQRALKRPYRQIHGILACPYTHIHTNTHTHTHFPEPWRDTVTGDNCEKNCQGHVLYKSMEVITCYCTVSTTRGANRTSCQQSSHRSTCTYKRPQGRITVLEKAQKLEKFSVLDVMEMSHPTEHEKSWLQTTFQ